MTQYEITAPSRFNHTIKLPASKSMSNRALIINALSGGKISPENDGDEIVMSDYKKHILLSL